MLPQPLPQEYESIVQEFEDLFQSRTRFQLEHFVVGQHDTEPMQFLQLCLDLKSLMQSYEMAVIEVKKGELKAARLLASDDEEERLDGEMAAINNRYNRIGLAAKRRELEIMLEMYRHAKKFTREEIEQDQVNYWHRRLHRQYMAERTGNTPGQIYAMWQAGMLDLDNTAPPPSILPSSYPREIEE